VTAGVALGARLFVAALAWNRFPPADDGVYYDTLAKRLAHGLGYTWSWPDGVVTPVAHYPVGYPWLLSLAYRAFGDHPASALLLHALLGTLGAVALHVVASFGVSPRKARWAGLGMALHPALLFYLPAIMTEGVAASLLPIPFAIVLWGVSRRALPSSLSMTAAGAVLGLVALVRPQLVVLAPVLVWLAASRVTGRARLAGPLLVLLGVALVIAPWALRNERAFGRVVLVSANGGWNLLIGTDPEAHGTWRQLEVPTECREVWDEAAKDACFGRVAGRRIRAAPTEWLSLAPSKLASTFDLGGTGPSYLSRSRPDLVPRWLVLVLGGIDTLVARAALGALLLAFARIEGRWLLARRILAGASLLCLLSPHAWPAYVGLVVLVPLAPRPETPRPLVLVAWPLLLATLLTHAAVFGASRYALMVLPWIAAVALATVVTSPRAPGSLRSPPPLG
jgi:4-amino-4-deoxy-L-arabinose transferase-like glycosyltransferase